MRETAPKSRTRPAVRQAVASGARRAKGARAAAAVDRPVARNDSDPLAAYRARRDFKRTPEPPPHPPTARATLAYFVQRHDARRLHYDFRLEVDGVLKSWAVPKGPSLDPAQKRLAVQTEDHPFDYGSFEGTIPAGEYGAGEVLLWDRGTWLPLHDPADGLAQGKLHFELRGDKLAGEWVLVRLAPRKSDRAGAVNWLLRKLPDAFARAGDDDGIVRMRPESVKRGNEPDARRTDKPGTKRSAKLPTPPTTKTTAEAGTKRRAAAPAAPAARAPARRASAARAAAVPEFIAPQLATLRAQPPRDAGWVYEVKFDGYRMLARIDRGDVRIVSRNAQDWTARLPTIAAAVRRLDLHDAWLDGEITVAGADGRTSFQALQNALDGAPGRIDYQLFDLLWLDGEDLRPQPLAARVARLRQLPLRAPLHLSGQLDADGATAWEAACRMQLEGLIGKRLDARYVSGRSVHWIKLKCRPSQEFVIGGWTDPAGTRELLGALLVGVHEDGRLRYAGRVGTGFTEATLRRLNAVLAPLARADCPFDPPPRLPRSPGVHWVEPQCVAQVEFAEWTDEGLLRQASFQGLRDDKPARAIVREGRQTGHDIDQGAARSAHTGRTSGRGRTARPGSAPPAPAATDLGRITHPERVIYPDAGLTKLDVARYYARIAPLLLSELQDRPLSLLRCPQGTQGTCFFQKHIATRLPPGLRHVTVQEKKGPAQYIAVADADGIVSLAQHGAIELHPWGSDAAHLDRPDRLIIDLDPDESIGWPTLLEAAWLTRTLLQELGLAAYVRTTGGKGLHVVAPLKPTCDWSTVKPFAQAIAQQLARVAPARFTSTMAKEQRRGRIFIDYLRNAEGATAIASYSLRARPGAPVAMPVAWDELQPKRDLRHDHFNLRNALAASQAAVQAWAGFPGDARAISSRMLRALGVAT
jgi:bifunctional non-homologous end joining protein LigD